MREKGMNIGFRVILIVSLVLGIGLVAAVGIEKIAASAGTVNIVIDADNNTAGIQNEITVVNGSQFTVVVWVHPQGGQEVSVVDARVDFDTSYLSVDNTSYDAFQNIMPHADTLFGNPVWRLMDNINGYADYSDGTAFMGTNPTTDFPAFYIVFNADNITSISGTPVTFHTAIPRKTDAFVGDNATVITGNLTGITIKVMETPTVDFTIDPASGNITAGDNVTFTAITTCGGPVENWAWDFDNNGTVDSTSANPTWNYGNVTGTYSVNLTGSNALGSDSEIKTSLITVSPDAPNKLVYNPAPATPVLVGDTWTTFKVEIRDQYDNLITSTDNVTVTPSSGAFVSGNTTRAAVAGVATFDGLIYDSSGKITVTASSGALLPAVSGKITIGTVFTATLQGGQRPPSGLNVPLTLKLYDNSTVLTFSNLSTEVPLYTFATASGNITITDNDTDNKTITFGVTGLPAGNYNITLVTPHCLTNLRNGVDIVPGSIDMGSLLEGDANSNNQVEMLDFGLLKASFMKSEGQEGYNAMADFDRSGQVVMLDFGLLKANFMSSSPIEVP